MYYTYSYNTIASEPKEYYCTECTRYTLFPIKINNVILCNKCISIFIFYYYKYYSVYSYNTIASEKHDYYCMDCGKYTLFPNKINNIILCNGCINKVILYYYYCCKF
jgi:hypothetical protein